MYISLSFLDSIRRNVSKVPGMRFQISVGDSFAPPQRL